MRRFTCTPRPDFRDRVMADGMVWPDETRPDGRRVPYWTDAAYYSFEPAEIDRLEDAVERLWPLCV